MHSKVESIPGPPEGCSLTAFIIGAAVASSLDGATTGSVFAATRGFGHPKSILQALAYKQFEEGGALFVI